MKHFFVVTNRHKDEDLKLTAQVQEYLVEKGMTCIIQDEEQLAKQCTDIAAIPADVECILVIGGDGTLIQAARDVVSREIPLIGINLGTLGYLAEVEEKNIFSALDSLISGEYEIENRMMLRGHVQGSDGEAFNNHAHPPVSELALNDIVISRRGSLRIVEYRIYVNGEHLYTYGADGMIISTPTGSTGYSLSAGGPIISPKASMLLITPICPHTLNTRSIVLSKEDEVVVEIGPGRKLESEYGEVSFDGTVSYSVSSGDRILVSCAKEKTSIVRINKESFLETLRKKMSDERKG